MILRDYQTKISAEAVQILKNKHIVYLAMAVRTGKSLTALNTAQLFAAKRVLFLTKKKAISSIQWDYDNFGFTFDLTIINDESLHLVNGEFDLIIHDEHHRFGAFPKPNATAKEFKKRFSKLPMIFLSGTPTPESYSQWYHQFWVSDYSPYNKYSNFYKWAAEYVDIKEKRLGYAVVKDYSNAKENLIRRSTRPYIITFTQKEAGFTTSVKEMVLECEMQPITYEVIRRLKKDLIVRNGQGQVILGDTGVKLMQKVHQLSSGTCKFEDGTSKVIDDSKAKFIKEKFQGEKIAIFYKFKAEWDALLQVFGADYLTNSVEEFDASDKNIALQIQSGKEGISLRNAKYLIYYNIDFSSSSYWQSRDRMSTMDRLNNEVFWIFAKGGIEMQIYNTVLKKKDFTLAIFRDKFLSLQE
jgi:superfamily II DNA or RNA helicase